MSENHILVKAVREIVAENPDFVYKPPKVEGRQESGSCVYVYKGKPSCLLGQAFAKVGLVVPDGMNHRGWGHPELQSAIGHQLEDLGHRQLSDIEINWLRRVQCHQDDGNSWGDCVKTADQQYRLP